MQDSETPDKIADIKLVAFKVGSQEYCVDIMSVREIRGWTAETTLPLAPEYVRGVINLRGSVVPVIDIAHRMEIQTDTTDTKFVTIIFEVQNQVIGFVVNDVTDIFTSSKDQIHQTPDVVSEAAQEFVTGVIFVEERMIGVLGLDNVLDVCHQQGLAA